MTLGDAELWCQRGVAEVAAQRYAEAEHCFDHAIVRQPRYFEALVRRGNVRLLRQRAEGAVADYTAALTLEPESAGTLYNRATALRALKRLPEALTDYEHAFALEPGIPHLEGARLAAKMQACDWRGFDVALAALLAHIDEGRPAAMPFVLATLPSSAAQQRLCATNYAARKYPAAPPLWRQRGPHDRIRVCYLSAGLREHVTALLAVGVFEHHDRARFEIIGIATTADDGSAMRRRLAAAFETFLDLSTANDQEIARCIAALEVDILIDLDGYTEGSRTGVIAHSPAPVQVNWLGYPGTLGAPYADYIIADAVVAPSSSEVEFSEAVVRLPGSYQPNSRTLVTAPIPSRAECGLPEQGLVFAAFHPGFKITPDVFAVWMRLLHVAPDSVLWLLDGGDLQKANLLREAAARGVGAERLVFAPWAPMDHHLARHTNADLFLDTRACNAHTTASDALWCGVPLVTCTGNAFAGRVAASLLTACGMPELITTSLKDYEAALMKLARDLTLLAATKEKLRSNRDTCALFDTARTTRALEDAYRIMWERHGAGLPPTGFAVTPLSPPALPAAPAAP